MSSSNDNNSSSIAPKKFLNDPSDAVSHYIQGLLYQYPNTIRKLSNHNVILSSNIKYDRVNILSGGGSGHEPSHAGYIGGSSNGGGGMLTGAILGGIFASPSVSSILAAIRAVTEPNNEKGGCLLVVKNYTGDRLNFGRACEIANGEGRSCAMVVVADDAALPREKGITGARGVAGTVFVHKVAGALASAGYDLKSVVEGARCAANAVKTLGVALEAVTVPGATTRNDRLDKSDIVEIGMGIHGEPGMKQTSMMTSKEFTKIMVDTVRDFGTLDDNNNAVPLFEKGDELAVLVNNLGGTSNFELSILANDVVAYIENELGCSVSRLYVGDYMTSFDMKGASVSILPMNSKMTVAEQSFQSLLDAETDAPAWSNADIWNNAPSTRPSMEEIPEVQVDEDQQKLSASQLQSVSISDFSSKAESYLRAAANALLEAEPKLTEYDTIVGDGDCGLTMARGAKEVLSRLDNKTLDTSHPVLMFSSIADAVSASMGGTSGVLLELMFRKVGSHLLALSTDINEMALWNAFQAGVEAVSLYGGATVGSRTMLDALFPAVEEKDSIEKAANAAENGAEGTATMLSASAGRSNYLRQDSLDGTPDPGAVAVGVVLRAMSKV